jgi:hypothetical protein
VYSRLSAEDEKEELDLTIASPDASKQIWPA